MIKTMNDTVYSYLGHYLLDPFGHPLSCVDESFKDPDPFPARDQTKSWYKADCKYAYKHPTMMVTTK